MKQPDVETTRDIDRMLEQTFADRRLSRGERQALRGVLETAEPSEPYLQLFRARAFEFARSRLTGADAREVLDWLEQIVKIVQPGLGPQRAARAYFSPEDDCVEAIVGLLRSAARLIDICVFTITDDRIAEAILAAQRRNVAVRILTDGEKAGDLGSDIDRFRATGLAVRVDPSPYHMHHKFAVFDARTLLTGSYNWTRAADAYNKDNFLVTEDPRLVQAFSATFERLWAQSNA
jgi:mitochondrial cardiolipin hydrolase